MVGILVAAFALCIPPLHEPLVELVVFSEGEERSDSAASISRAFMLIGCMILATLRVVIPLFIAAPPLEAQRGLMMDW